MSEYEFLRVTNDNGMTHVTLCRPPANALSLDLMHEILRLTTWLSTTPGIRALILRSDVPGMWVAGADLKDTEQRLAGVAQTNRLLRSAYDAWERLPFATIAQINGHALGGGCELALVCDFRLMARGRGRIGLPEAHRGLLAAAGGSQRLTRLLGRGRAMDLLLRGRMLDADQAEQIGLIHQACYPDELERECTSLADEFLHLAPLTVAATKRAIIEGADLPLAAGLTLEGYEMIQLTATDDVKEGIRAFIEKREPNFVGR